MNITLIQASLVWGDAEQNLRNFDEKLAKCTGSDIILLPEMFTSGCMMVKREAAVARKEQEKIAASFEQVLEKMYQWAKRQKALVMGSTVYREEGKYYNRLLVVFPDGRVEYYDKRHCFRMGGENEYYSPGKRRLVFEYKGIKVAAFICYDLRFPVWSRNVENYDLAVYVANWPASRRDVWTTLLKARAIENQCYVAGVNCVGTDKNGLYYAGDSMVLDAKGECMAGASEGKEEVLSTELNPDHLRIFREKFDVLKDRDDFEWK